MMDLKTMLARLKSRVRPSPSPRMIADSQIDTRPTSPAREFTTKHGHVIQEIPGYWELYENARRAVLSSGKVTADDQRDFSVGIYAFAKDVYEFYIMLDNLKDAGIELDAARALDVGGQEGIVSRLLNATGAARVADCVDILEFAKGLDDEGFVRLLDEYAAKLAVGSPEVLANFASHFDHPLDAQRLQARLPLGRKGEIGRYFSSGLMNMPDEVTYDFVSVLLALPYFDLDRLFLKLARLTRPGSIIYSLSDYWWGQCNSTALTGGMPWCIQRLEPDDIQRYFATLRPEVPAAIIKSRLAYYHEGNQRPTAADYVAKAQQYGFRLIALHRHISRQPDGERTFRVASDLYRHADAASVLRDIHAFKPDVAEVDLRTAFISATFVRT